MTDYELFADMVKEINALVNEETMACCAQNALDVNPNIKEDSCNGYPYYELIKPLWIEWIDVD